MPPAARLPDATLDGAVSVGSPNTFINGLPAARHVDPVCVHGPGVIVRASANVRINSLGAGRLGDPVSCQQSPGSILTGSPNVFVGG